MNKNREPICFKGKASGTAGSAACVRGGCPTLIAEQPVHVVYCLQGNGIDRADTTGCNGRGWREDASYTLNTIDRPAVCYSADCRNIKLNDNLSGTLCAKSATGGTV